MSAVSPYADPRVVNALLGRIHEEAPRRGRPLVIMEVCGTHTHAVAEAGFRRRLLPSVRLVSGPGCPVCVTPVDYLDRAEALARLPRTVVCTFGDLFRVPSSRGSLERARAQGARVEVVYSPRDALALAKADAATRVVFLAVGFETTAPAVAASLLEAEREDIPNFCILPGHKVVPPPLRALAQDAGARPDGFLLPGHVSVITGSQAFAFLAEEHGLPSVVAGFTAADILRGVLELCRMAARGETLVANLYGRAVTAEGNREAQALLERFFAPEESVWRGLGRIPASGLSLREEWRHRDASRTALALPEPLEPPGCLCGRVLTGAVEPPECPLFGDRCTPDLPLGACMVSSEGTCAAWYRHERHRLGQTV